DVPRRVPVLATPPLPAFEGRLFPSASLGLPYSVREPSTSELTRESNRKLIYYLCLLIEKNYGINENRI
ncbi:10641_t:CDS:2, partial [Cetraspora pellucida]